MRAYNFDLCAVGELLDGVTVLRVVLQQDGHLEGGGLQRVPEHNNISIQFNSFIVTVSLANNEIVKAPLYHTQPDDTGQ